MENTQKTKRPTNKELLTLFEEELEVAKKLIANKGEGQKPNELVTIILNVISVSELYFQTKSIAGNNFRYFESFFVACILYFIMTFTVTRILRYLDCYFFDGCLNTIPIR